MQGETAVYRTSAGQQAAVRAQSLDALDSVVQRALDVVDHILRGGAHDDGGHAGVLLFHMVQNDYLASGHLLQLNTALYNK